MEPWIATDIKASRAQESSPGHDVLESGMSRHLPLEPPRILLFHKPYGVLSQFTDGAGRPTLADYVREPGLYAAGRLDADSEGLLVLTSTAWVKSRLMDPAPETEACWAQVEVAAGVDVEAALARLRGRRARRRTHAPGAGASTPGNGGAHAAPGLKGCRSASADPARGRGTGGSVDDLSRNQVRRMAATVGLPTLRLVRAAVGPWRLDGLASGGIRRVRAFRRAISPRPAGVKALRRPALEHRG
jgi:23S rRNA pseudouridine2457 synthase